jgi:carboxypeptidase family protein
MRSSATRVAAVVALLLLPAVAAAQTSGIAGEVKDTSGAVLPGVMVEAASAALIERVRSVATDDSGRYNIIQLRPGIYTVTFTLPGFSTVKRENIELTSDFTATINAELKVGAIEETITVAAESPVVDVQSITSRTVMTRDVLDAIPTGRNIQAVGIMIPGTSIAVGGGGALSRDVGGSGNLQQSPLQYRGSGDSVQTIEGLRLNNLCAQGAYSGVYWNDGSFEELSYVTGADSAEMGQGGMRINMVPRDGGNTFRGSIIGNYTHEPWASNNLRDNLVGDLTFNPGNRLVNIGAMQRIWDFNPTIGGPIKRDRAWFNFTFRHWGVEKTVADSFFDTDSSPFRYSPDTNRPGVDDGHIVSRAGRIAWQISEKDKLTSYHDDQNKYRDHWGISAAVLPEATAIQVTPTSFVHATRWTRTQTNRLLLDAGIGIYDQEYTELYQPAVLDGFGAKVWDADRIRASRVYNVLDQSNGKRSEAWGAPADHFSLRRNYVSSLSYVTGSHAFKTGVSISEGNWRLVEMFTGDVGQTATTGGVTYNNGRPVSVTLRLPNERRNRVKMDMGLYVQDRWAIGRATLNLGIRYDRFIGETGEGDILPNRFNAGQHFGKCADGRNDSRAGCAGKLQDWQDVSPRVGIAFDVKGDGRTSIKTSFGRYVADQQIAFANQANPVTVLGLTDTRGWTDFDGNGLPFDANGNLQLVELAPSSSTPTFGRNVSTQNYDPAVVEGWFKRGYNWEYTFAAQHEIMPRVALNGGYYIRWFGNQTFTDDLRYDNSSYDGPFCVTAPANSNLPGGGGYEVCNLYDLKPGLQNIPANSLIRFAKDFGGEVNRYQGFDVNLDARLPRGAFVKAGIAANARTFDECYQTTVDSPQTETYADGSRYCHRAYPLRPDFKASGSVPLPGGIQFSAVYQFSRGVQNGGAGPSVLATWPMNNTLLAQFSNLGRNLTAGGSKSVQLIREGLEYGDQNLSQLDLRASKRFTAGRFRFRIDADLYNATNSNWPYTVTTTFSTAATSAWLRPTNVLQSRMFKIGGQFDF